MYCICNCKCATQRSACENNEPFLKNFHHQWVSITLSKFDSWKHRRWSKNSSFILWNGAVSNKTNVTTMHTMNFTKNMIRNNSKHTHGCYRPPLLTFPIPSESVCQWVCSVLYKYYVVHIILTANFLNFICWECFSICLFYGKNWFPIGLKKRDTFLSFFHSYGRSLTKNIISERKRSSLAIRSPCFIVYTLWFDEKVVLTMTSNQRNTSNKVSVSHKFK